MLSPSRVNLSGNKGATRYEENKDDTGFDVSSFTRNDIAREDTVRDENAAKTDRTGPEIVVAKNETTVVPDDPSITRLYDQLETFRETEESKNQMLTPDEATTSPEQ